MCLLDFALVNFPERPIAMIKSHLHFCGIIVMQNCCVYIAIQKVSLLTKCFRESESIQRNCVLYLTVDTFCHDVTSEKAVKVG